jgi:hypothetical protein
MAGESASVRMEPVYKTGILLRCGLSAFGTDCSRHKSNEFGGSDRDSLHRYLRRRSWTVVPGTYVSFTSDNVNFSDTSYLAVGGAGFFLPHSFWFGGQGSPPNWGMASNFSNAPADNDVSLRRCRFWVRD